MSAAALLAAGAVGAVGWPASPPPASPPPARPASGPVSLVAYDGCDQFLAAVKARALREVGPYGLQGYGGYPLRYAQSSSAGSSAGMGMASSGAPAAAPVVNGADSATPAFSTTNDQVAGADEPDIVKTDGHVMAVLRSDPVGLQVASVGGLVPRLDGFLALASVGSPTGMFLTGGDAVILSRTYGDPSGPGSEVTVVNVADPAQPAVVRSFDLGANEVDARLIAGRVVVVLQGDPHLPFTYPSGATAAAIQAATDRNRSVIESSTISDWLPTVTAQPSGKTTTADCADLLHPPTGTGFATTSVVSLNPASDQPGRATTIVGDVTTVYASTDALYVATVPGMGPVPYRGAAQYMPTVAGSATDIAKFDLTDPAHVRYAGSGSVPGQLIGQYALDEYQGDLRVATTTGQATPAPGEGSAPVTLSDSRITVLAPQGGALVPVGVVAGLGAGEKIYAVRYEGPLAYVVTFRQTDPLYVVDLSNPAHPVAQGQLQLTGYSSFLQPLGRSLLLGVGQQVDSHLRQAGLQLSVFDVSDPQVPALRSRADLSGDYSAAQYDPHALLWWPARRLVALPLADSSASFAGVAVWRVGSSGALHPVARLAQPAAPASSHVGLGPGPEPAVVYTPPGAQREVVVGDLLYTISPSGIMASDMDTWSQVAWLPFS